MLLQSGGLDSFSPWLRAIKKGDIKTLDALLKTESQYHIDFTGKTSHTALHWAAMMGNITMAKYLLEKGASPNCKTVLGITALHYAVETGHFALVKLLAPISELDAIDDHYESPLFYAAKSGHIQIASFLLDHKANADLVNVRGYKASYVARKNGFSAIEALIKKHETSTLKNFLILLSVAMICALAYLFTPRS